MSPRRRALSFAGKRVLLTGAAGGIGTALAHRLARRGASLLLTDRSEGDLSALAAALPRRSVAGTAAADLTDEAGRVALSALVEASAGGSLDVLIHNAGVAPGGRFLTQPEAAIVAAIDVNLRAALLLTRRLLPRLLERPRAAIGVVASGAGLVGPAGLAAYAASKAGLIAFAQALRAEHRGRLGVSVVCPAFVRTDIIRTTARLVAGSAAADAPASEALDRWIKRVGLPPERVARALVDALERDRRCVPLGGVTRGLVALHALSPALSERLSHALFRALVSSEVLR